MEEIKIAEAGKKRQLFSQDLKQTSLFLYFPTSSVTTEEVNWVILYIFLPKW